MFTFCQLCDGYRTRCFEAQMLNATVLKTSCECLPECEYLQFSPVVNTYDLGEC